jgi:hypothetical protein
MSRRRGDENCDNVAQQKVVSFVVKYKIFKCPLLVLRFYDFTDMRAWDELNAKQHGVFVCFYL